HRVAMADLRELLTSEGHGEVRTLLQSGSVVLDSELPAEELLAAVAGDSLGSVVVGDPARDVGSFFAGRRAIAGVSSTCGARTARNWSTVLELAELFPR
ncbi:MAG: uncharacterized protein JWP68_247, partial [Modestobacter sp.]|nr:uncharacterized protein [Modestobacter sp.]